MGCQPSLLTCLRRSCMHVRARSPLGPIVCGNPQESVSMTASITEQSVAQPARFCRHGEIYNAKRASLLTNHEGLRRVRVDLAGGAGTLSPVANACKHDYQSPFASCTEEWARAHTASTPGMCLPHSVLRSRCTADVARQGSTPNHPSLSCQLHDDFALCG